MNSNRKMIVKENNVTPKEYRWSEDKRSKAAKEGKFVRVGGSQVVYRYISKAPERWSAEKDNDVYVENFSIAGHPKDIRKALEYAGISSSDIDRALESAISKASYQKSHKERFDSLVRHEVKPKRSALPAVRRKSSLSVADILMIGSNFSKVKVVPDKREKVNKSKKPTKPLKSLPEKVRDLPKGKLLDVSDMTAEGAKTRVSAAPVKSSKTGKFHVPGFPFLSNDPKKLSQAVEAVYGADEAKEAKDRITSAHRDYLVSERTRKQGVKPVSKKVGKPKVQKGKSPSRSPSRKRSVSPGKKGVKSPSRKRSVSPGKKGVKSPSRKRSVSPGKKGVKSPSRKRSVSPGMRAKSPDVKSPTRKAKVSTMKSPSKAKVSPKKRTAKKTFSPKARDSGSTRSPKEIKQFSSSSPFRIPSPQMNNSMIHTSPPKSRINQFSSPTFGEVGRIR